MHNLALALHEKGDTVTGSDDAIFEPSQSRLEEKGLLPQSLGWFPEKIHSDLDAIILGMHAKADNPELLKAQDLGLTIIMVTHEDRMAAYAERIIRFLDGRIESETSGRETASCS